MGVKGSVKIVANVRVCDSRHSSSCAGALPQSLLRKSFAINAPCLPIVGKAKCWHERLFACTIVGKPVVLA